jgi:hypothetical protein
MRKLTQQPIALAGVLLVVLAVVAVLLGASSDGGSKRGQGSLDGIVVNAQQGTVVMSANKPFEGKTQVTFEIRPRDAAAVDVQHMQQHAQQGLQTRLFYEREGGKLYAVGQQDLGPPPAQAE